MRSELKHLEGLEGHKIDPLNKIKRKEKKSIEKPIFKDVDNVLDEFEEGNEGSSNKKGKKSFKLNPNMFDEFTEEDELEF